MAWLCDFFFANLARIHQQFKNLFGADDEQTDTQESDVDDSPEISASEAAARYYFQLTYELGKKDLTKVKKINKLNMYLCLNAASLMKDRSIARENQLKKMKQNIRNT